MLYALMLAVAFLCAPVALAQGEPEVRGPVETVEDGIEEKKSEKQLKIEARLAEVAEAQAARIARVVVLQWGGTDTDYTHETIRRNIRVRIARNEATFYPEIDLYQAGRKEPDRTIRAVDQRAVVPDRAIDRVLEAAEDTSTIPWDALSAQDWGLKAFELRELAKEIWFVDRPELREPLFLLYAQIGYAAENRSDSSPPFFEHIGGEPVNYYWYLAGAMAHEEPGLMSKLTATDTHSSIGYYKDKLDRGDFPPMMLSFELSGDWDAGAFTSEYQLFINGLDVVVTDDKGLHRAPPGRVDVYFSRDDGHSLSDRIELDKLDEKIYNVRDVARQRMGIQFIDQLMENPFECIPDVDGDILNYLAIYAKLHPDADVYIAVPEGGSTAAHKIFLWRWDRAKGHLKRVEGAGEFPVRFAMLVGAGLTFNNATYAPMTSEELANNAAAANPGNPTAGLDSVKRAADELPNLAPAGVPIHFHLRGHYGRLLIATGLEFSANVSKDGPWRDRYQTNTDPTDPSHDLKKLDTVKVLVPDDISATDPALLNCADTNVACTEQDIEVEVDVLRERVWQRLVFLGVGVVLGKDASIGFGPRFLFRTGWYNAPHAVDLSGHIGWSARLGKKPQGVDDERAKGRVFPLLDVNLFGGGMVPYRDSVYVQGTNGNGVPKKLGKSFVTFGFQVSAGMTF